MRSRKTSAPPPKLYSAKDNTWMAYEEAPNVFQSAPGRPRGLRGLMCLLAPQRNVPLHPGLIERINQSKRIPHFPSPLQSLRFLLQNQLGKAPPPPRFPRRSDWSVESTKRRLPRGSRAALIDRLKVQKIPSPRLPTDLDPQNSGHDREWLWDAAAILSISSRRRRPKAKKQLPRGCRKLLVDRMTT